MTQPLPDPLERLEARLNEGRRPSLLDLGRRATGEVPGEVDPLTAAAFEEAREAVAPLDLVVLRARAVRVAEAEARSAARAASEDSAGLPWTERLKAWWVAGALLPVLAAALLVVQLPTPGEGPSDLPTDRTKGRLGADSVHLDFLLLQDGDIVHGGPDVVARPGDRIQFRYEARGFEELVLLSIDGEGTLTVFWPEAGEEPEAVSPRGEQLLEGSVILDDAPGPEAFVAIFGTASVAEAEALAAAAWERDGLRGLDALARDDEAVDLVVVERGR